MRNHSNENEFDLHENVRARETHFSYERFRTKTRFETEAKGNSEMAYSSGKNLFLLRKNGIFSKP